MKHLFREIEMKKEGAKSTGSVEKHELINSDLNYFQICLSDNGYKYSFQKQWKGDSSNRSSHLKW